MNIRSANKTDSAKIQKLVLSLSHYYLNEQTAILPAWFLSSLSLTEFENRFSSKEFKNFVVEIDAEIVGYIAIKGNSNLYHLFVAQAFQGNGIAKQLWLHAIKFLNAPIITLRSSIYAVPVYKKWGFVEFGAIGEKEGILFQPMQFKRSC